MLFHDNELLEYMDVHDNDASERLQPSWGEILPEDTDDTFSIGIALENVYFVVFVLGRNIMFASAGSSSNVPADYVSAGHVLVPADRDRIC
ncbi:hypothetical protein Tco_1102516 [Tanacetum coccineum]